MVGKIARKSHDGSFSLGGKNEVDNLGRVELLLKKASDVEKRLEQERK